METKPFRIYADTSVFGGCYDKEFAEDSLRFFEGVQRGEFVLLVTEVVIAELADAPKKVREVLLSLPPGSIERIEIDEQIISLRNGYLDAGILTIISPKELASYEGK